MTTRSCPSCGATYPEGVLFCGEDGTVVIQDQSASDFDGRLGKQLGGYIAAARVADGAMGRVYEGRHPETKARVAIKVLHADVARDRVAFERFKREFESAMELKHPHIVKVLEFGETPDHAPFLTMEYLDGQELSKLIGHDQPLPAARVVRVICQVALALEHAHSFGFIHRDLKPDNIVVCHTAQGDDVRILDFGSVKLQLEMGNKLTAIGTTIGSPFYMSPEQAMGRADVDQRTDVFALGAILYEMVTARVAFDAPNLARILVRIMNDSPAPPTSINRNCPPTLDRVVDKALRKAKEERYGSGRELALAVIAAYGLSGSVEDWANRPEAEIERELEAARARAPQPPSPPRPMQGLSYAEPAARGEATEPRLSLAGEERGGPVLATGANLMTMALIALSVVVAGGVLVLLFR